MTTYQCVHCKEVKTETDFYYRNVYRVSNRYATCKTCVLKQQKEKKKKNFPQHLFTLVRRRAQRENIPFDLDIFDIVIPNTCPILGVPLKVGPFEDRQFSPSIDRLDPDSNIGYIKGNIKIVSYRGNQLKNDATLSEMRAVLKYMKENNCP